VREEEPADDAADDVACREGDVDVEGLGLAEAGGLEEDDRVAEDGVAAEDLGGPDDAVLSLVSVNVRGAVGEEMLTISVRRRLVPRKQSRKVAFSVSASSMAVVWRM